MKKEETESVVENAEEVQESASLGDISVTFQNYKTLGTNYFQPFFLVTNNSGKTIKVKIKDEIYLNGVAISAYSYYEEEIKSGRSTQLYYNVEYDRLMNGSGKNISDMILSISLDGGTYEEVELNNLGINLPW
jgi:hypothetical protein